MAEPTIAELAAAVERALTAIGQARAAYDDATVAVRREHSPDARLHAAAAIARIRTCAVVLAATQQALRDACPACRPLRRWTGCPAHELALMYC